MVFTYIKIHALRLHLKSHKYEYLHLFTTLFPYKLHSLPFKCHEHWSHIYVSCSHIQQVSIKIQTTLDITNFRDQQNLISGSRHISGIFD